MGRRRNPASRPLLSRPGFFAHLRSTTCRVQSLTCHARGTKPPINSLGKADGPTCPTRSGRMPHDLANRLIPFFRPLRPRPAIPAILFQAWADSGRVHICVCLLLPVSSLPPSAFLRPQESRGVASPDCKLRPSPCPPERANILPDC